MSARDGNSFGAEPSNDSVFVVGITTGNAPTYPAKKIRDTRHPHTANTDEVRMGR